MLDVRGIEIDKLRKEPFPTVGHEFRVALSEAAFDRMAERGNAEQSREIGGVLVGRLLRDDAGPYVRIDTTIDALHAEEKGTELTFTHATWEHIHKEMDAHHTGASIVGWYHTHPGFGIFLSDRDEFIHQSFFNLPHQVAVVYDPRSREHGVFVWQDGKPARARRYWIGAVEQVWDGSRTPVAAKPTSAPRESAPSPGEPHMPATEARSPRVDWQFLGTTAFVSLLLGGMVGWWFGTRNEAELTERTRVLIAQERMVAAQETARAINPELLSILRQAALGAGAQRPILDALGDLDRALQGLQQLCAPGPATAEQPAGAAPGPVEVDKVKALAQQLAQGLQRLRGICEQHVRADQTLQTLEAIGRSTQLDPKDLMRLLTTLQSASGQLAAELAETAIKAGDVARGRRLLQQAEMVDPLNAATYQRRRETLKEGH